MDKQKSIMIQLKKQIGKNCITQNKIRITKLVDNIKINMDKRQLVKVICQNKRQLLNAANFQKFENNIEYNSIFIISSLI